MNLKIKAFNLLFDVFIIVFAFLSISIFKDEDYFSILDKYDFYVYILIFVFVIVSLFFSKYEKKTLLNNKQLGERYFLSWLFASLICLSLIYIFRVDFISRFIMFGILLLVLLFEFIWLIISYVINYPVTYEDNIQNEHNQIIENSKNENHENIVLDDDEQYIEKNELIELMQKHFGVFVIDTLKKYIQLNSNKTEFIETSNVFSVITKPFGLKALVNFSRINDARRINKLFEAVNVKLSSGATFVCCAETNGIRKIKFKKKFKYSWSILYFFDFLVRRVWAKIPYINAFYFAITKGRNRALSHAEVLGRLYSCGFVYVDSFEYGNLRWFVVKKESDSKTLDSPTYGPLIKLRRIGKNGTFVNVYKLRTMHPYSEFLQKYVYEHNSFDEKGKFKDDFRITTLGKFFRKIWLDEFPMLWNIVKGDVKIVGVRPLSQQFYNLYPEDVKAMRIKYKPGLVPPYYVDLPNGFDEVVESERKYLLRYQKSPIITDFKYFFKAFYNIIFLGARSR